MDILSRQVFSTVGVAMLIVMPLSASMQTFIEGKMGGSYSSVSPGYFKSQTASNYTGGSMSIRWGGSGGVVNPVHITPPSMSVGCDGIDMAFGSFSFLGPDVFVEKAKLIAQSAPAFAFKMALSTLCKECDTIMQELEAAINTINGISMDSCGISQRLGTIVGDAIGQSISLGDSDDYSEAHAGFFSDPNGKFQQYMAATNAVLGGDWETTRDEMAYGSMLRRIMRSNNNFLTSEAWMEPLMRGLYGDLYGYNYEGKKDKLTSISPSIDIEKFIDLMMLGQSSSIDTLIAKGLEEDIVDNIPHEPFWPEVDQVDSVNLVLPDGIVGLVSTNIESIKTKVVARSALDPTEIDFLNNISVPVWRAINAEVSTIRRNQNASFLTKEVYLSIAYLQVEQLLRYFNTAMMVGVVNIENGIGSLIDDEERKVIDAYKMAVEERVRESNRAIYRLRDKYVLSTDTELMAQIEKFEKDYRRHALARSFANGL